MKFFIYLIILSFIAIIFFRRKSNPETFFDRLNTRLSIAVAVATLVTIFIPDDKNVEVIGSGSLLSICPGHYVVYDKSGEDLFNPSRDLKESLKKGLDNMPSLAGKSIFLYNITNNSEGNTSVTIDKTLSVHVSFESVPEHVNEINVFNGCGAGGVERRFDPIYLQNEGDSRITYKDDSVDYLILKPGDVEVLNIPFECVIPGIYKLDITAHIKYLDKQKDIPVKTPPLVCPKDISTWSANMSLNSENNTGFVLYGKTNGSVVNLRDSSGLRGNVSYLVPAHTEFITFGDHELCDGIIWIKVRIYDKEKGTSIEGWLAQDFTDITIAQR